MNTDRLESFSDGVFAIAATLLILELNVPQNSDHLLEQLGNQWPSYAAYVLSFLVIGIVWVNHHAMFTHIVRIDRIALFLNLVLLMFVAAIPFPTAVYARNLTNSDDAHVAAAIYSTLAFLIVVVFICIWLWVTRRPGLLADHLDTHGARKGMLRFSFGLVAYPILFGLSFVSPRWTLAGQFAVALYYVFEHLQPEEVTEAIQSQSAH